MRTLALIGFLSCALLASGFAPETTDRNDPVIGQPAPAFTLVDTNGNEHSLADYQGQYVILEWLNFDCPFVRKHYSSGNFPALQKQFREEGVAWLSIVSSARGTQGYFPPTEMNARNEREGGQQTAILIDEPGTVGRSYGALVTPHMYIINPDGILIYNGAIDDRPTARVADVEGARNYVVEAMEAARAGRAIEVSSNQPYGCTVKYRN
jgi:hypothetical protein